MKKLNKKGFTIVELVIVIAVIAILAAVLIPTFATVINKANESAALQNARNTYTEYIATLGKDVPSSFNYIVKGDSTRFFAVVNGQMSTTVYSTASGAEVAFSDAASGYTKGAVAVSETSFADKVFNVFTKSSN